MGKSGMQNKAYGKVVGKDAADRPGWKGPGYTKKPKAAPKKSGAETIETGHAEAQVPVELQQLLLNIFRDSFPATLGSTDLGAVLQEIKGALYERDFERAFGEERFLEAYSVRWSPSRALCYLGVLGELQEHLRGLSPLYRRSRGRGAVDGGSEKAAMESCLRVVAFGGGAAEVVALGGFVRLLQDAVAVAPLRGGRSARSVSTSAEESPRIEVSTETEPVVEAMSEVALDGVATDFPRDCGEAAQESPSSSIVPGAATSKLPDAAASKEIPYVDLLLLDSASWGKVIQTLDHSLKTPPTLSKYASTAAREANTSMLGESDILTSFQQENLLSLTLPQLGDLLGKAPTLMTLLFTLNELYTSSISKTTGFLMKMTAVAKPGSILLVVDSPGSYSETSLGQESKKYPMKWLLDHTLLESAKSGEGRPGWEKVVERDSNWCRIAEELAYPISLENMRFQVHLYRRL